MWMELATVAYFITDAFRSLNLNHHFAHVLPNRGNATFHLTNLTEEQKLAFTDGLDHYHKGHINHKGNN